MDIGSGRRTAPAVQPASASHTYLCRECSAAGVLSEQHLRSRKVLFYRAAFFHLLPQLLRSGEAVSEIIPKLLQLRQDDVTVLGVGFQVAAHQGAMEGRQTLHTPPGRIFLPPGIIISSLRLNTPRASNAIT